MKATRKYKVELFKTPHYEDKWEGEYEVELELLRDGHEKQRVKIERTDNLFLALSGSNKSSYRKLHTNMQITGGGNDEFFYYCRLLGEDVFFRIDFITENYELIKK